MQTKDSKIVDKMGIILLYTAPAASVGCCCLLVRETITDAFSNIVLALILASIYFTFLHMNQGYFYQKISHKMLFFISFFMSFVFLGMAAEFFMGILWMAVVAVAALDSGIELAVATHVVLMIQYAFLLLPQDKGFYRFSGCILFGMAVALLFSLFKELNTGFYLALILLACDGVLQLVVCQFSLSLLRENWMAALAETGSVLFLVLTGVFYLKAYGAGQWRPETEKPLEETGQGCESVQEEEKKENPKEEAVLQMVTASDYELLLRLKEYSEEIFMHSQRISVLSERAAEVIGGDGMLAKAGGLYHEIGRMEDEDDYIEAGTRIGREYGFPESLLTVMRQHSTAFELPESTEAAVVMLSDCIVSTSEYLLKNGKRGMLSDEQLVSSVFQNRLEKGNLKFAGMTMEQMRSLQDFYAKNAFLE